MAEQFSPDAVRGRFPVLQNLVYLDAAFQTPLGTHVHSAFERFYREGLEQAGPKSLWLERVGKVRERLARLIGAKSSEIAFTKNTSEGLNIAANAIPFAPGDNVLMIEGDHPNNAYAFLNLRRKGVTIRFVPLNGETADAATFAPHIDKNTRAISLSHVTFHAGHKFDIESIGQLAKAHGLYLVVDAMQSVGVMPLNVAQSNISMLAFGCHKGLYVPQGLGALYVREGQPELQPAYLAVAGLQEPPADLIARADNMQLRDDAGRFELGNFNLPGIHALDASLEFIESLGVDAIQGHVLELGDYLIEQIDGFGVALVGPRDRANRSHIYVLALPADVWVDELAKSNIRVSPERDGIRISFGCFNTKHDIDQLIAAIRTRLG